MKEILTELSAMPFPVSQREVYDKNPLIEVICQLRFPTILRVTAETPAKFQDAIRDSYPLYREESPIAGLPKEITDVLGGLPVPQVLQQREHKFLTENENRVISLTQDFIAVTEEEYERWEHFRREIKHAESAFRAIYKPAFYERVGLRYRDVLKREELGLDGRPWAELLRPSFIGELGAESIGEKILDIRTQSLVSLPDVQNGLVRIQHGLTNTADSEQQVYVIDADFYATGRRESSDAFQILDTFNNWGGRLFRWAASPALREALGPTKI